MNSQSVRPWTSTARLAATKDVRDVKGRCSTKRREGETRLRGHRYSFYMCRNFIVRFAFANPDTIACGLSNNVRTYAPRLSDCKIQTIKASMEVSESECKLRMIMPTILEVRNLLLMRSMIRIRDVMKKTLLEV